MFLAHLSQRLWISYCDCSPAVIRPSSIQVRTTSLKPLGQFLTLNQWVLSIVERGYKISFKEHPLLSYKPVLIPQTERKELEDVNSLHQKRTVAETSTKSPGFYSRINLVHRKKNVQYEANNRFFYPEQIHSPSGLQNRDAESQKCDSLKLLGSFFGSNGRLLTSPDPPKISGYIRFTLRENSGLLRSVFQRVPICSLILCRK